jgi:pimeloyl-ACP methyl ester carboxylesterase
MATLLTVAPLRAGTNAGASADTKPAEITAGDSAVITRGSAGPGVVLLSGLLGGTARLAPLADTLAREGFRVIVIDPYLLGARAPDVSFHGLAREVEAVLAQSGMESAVIVAHAHATTIAVCLAADAPERVQQLILLDGGLLQSTKSPGISRALQVAMFIAHLPGGKALIRARMTAGIRANSGDRRWLTDAVAHQYADPLLAQLPDVARMVRRLSAAREPESVGALLTHVRTEITVLLGAVPHDSAPDEAELAPLAPLATVHIRRLVGVGHFVHEEALSEVVREVEAAHARVVASLR